MFDLNHETATNEDPEMDKVVLGIHEITAIAALVFRSIVEMARIALQEAQRRSLQLIRREEIKPR